MVTREAGQVLDGRRVTGGRLGNELDCKVLDNPEYRACGHTFRRFSV
ncbi:MAG: hypothetical protein ACQEXG_09960 [Pseudomonadota bacterium]